MTGLLLVLTSGLPLSTPDKFVLVQFTSVGIVSVLELEVLTSFYIHLL
jgi:hypothetical protein